MRSRILLWTTLMLGALSALAQADASGFIPRPTENGAFLSAEGSRETDDLRTGPRQWGWTDSFFREKLTVFSNGYIYHPRFLQYRLSVGGALKQEKYRALIAPPASWKSGTGIDYSARLLVLPEHPYNAELFAQRFAPQFKERSAIEHDSVANLRGAFLRYRRKPYFFDAGAETNSLESTSSRSDVTVYRLGGQYFKEYNQGRVLSLSAFANPTRFTGTSVEGRTRQYLADGLLTFPRFRFSLSANQNHLEQSGQSSPVFESDQKAFSPQLNATLPLGFRGSLSYGYRHAEGSVQAVGSQASRPVSDTGRNIHADVSQRLYQSLDTGYTFLRARTTSSQGDNTHLSHGLTVSYSKTIPRGRVRVGANRGWGTTDSVGQGDVVNEPHLAQAVPGSFLLLQPEVDPRSIRLLVKSPITPFETVLLVENVDFVVLPVLNTLEIRVLTLPARFVVPGTYDFYVSYTQARASFGLHSDTLGANLRVELFDDLLAPYASYVSVRSDVYAGALPGPPLDTTNRAAGLAFHKGSLRARAEYQTVDWAVSPSRTWTTDAQYLASLARTTRVSATASYQNRYFPQGASPSLPQPIRDELAQASGNVQQQLFSRALIVAGGGSLTWLMGRARGHAYGVNGSLSWRIGRLTLDAGASASWSDARAEISAPTSRTHEFYYFTLRRQLF
jgi:hypothetical protein